MQSLDAFARDILANLDRQTLRRTLSETARLDGPWVQRDGQRLLSFCCNDYLNLSTHPAVIEAAVAATRQFGAGAGASRLVTGNHPLYAALEARLARLKGTEDACVFGSGYLANTGIVPVLAGRDDLVLVDELAHACLWAGSRLTRGRVLPFRHNDVAHAEALLAAERAKHPRALILTDGVFSMDGDLAPLPALAALAQRTDSWLMADDAHGIGVLGGGRGAVHAGDAPAAVPLQMGTLSKAIGGYGGYLCASRPVIDLMRTRSRTFIYSTGLPPGTVAAAIAALDVIEADPDFAASPLRNARMFTRLAGLPEAASPIVPLILGDAGAALAASRLLAAEGYLVSAIRPPTVPDGTARLRFTFTAGHAAADIARLAAIVTDRVLAGRP
ncbi:MAG: 8-amino-7-oxononanoate synthase [Acetobacteraceae bacterium]